MERAVRYFSISSLYAASGRLGLPLVFTLLSAVTSSPCSVKPEYLQTGPRWGLACAVPEPRCNCKAAARRPSAPPAGGSALRGSPRPARARPGSSSRPRAPRCPPIGGGSLQCRGSPAPLRGPYCGPIAERVPPSSSRSLRSAQPAAIGRSGCRSPLGPVPPSVPASLWRAAG